MIVKDKLTALKQYLQQSGTWRPRGWYVLAAAIVVAIVGLLTAPYLIDINSYRSRIINQLEQRLGRSVTLGVLSLRLFPSAKIKADDVVIGDDPQFSQRAFIKAQSVRLQIGIWSLLTGNPSVSSIELTQPVVTLVKERNETWNWSTLKSLQAAKPGEELTPIDLIVRDGRFILIDRTQNAPAERTYTGVDVELENFSSRSASRFVLAVTMPGDQAGRLQMAGTIGPINLNDFKRTPIEARLQIEQAELAGLEALLGQSSSRAGRITLDAEVQGKLAESIEAKGKLKAEKLKIAEGGEASGIPLEAEFKITTTPKERSDYALKIAQGELKLGGTQLSVTGEANPLLTEPALNLQIKGDAVALDGLLESARAFGFGPPAGTSASGSAKIDLSVSGPLTALLLNGQAEIRDLKFKSTDLPQAIEVSRLELTFSPAAITASQFRTALGTRTSVEVSSFSLSNYTRQMRARFELATQNAQLEDLLKIAAIYGARLGFSGTGLVTLKAAIDLKLGQEGGPTTINGQGSLNNARIKIPQLTEPLVVNAAALNFAGDSLQASNLQSQLARSHITGWVRIKNFDHPAVSFDLKLDQLVIAELQKLVARNETTQMDHSAPASGLISQAIAQTKNVAAGSTAIPADGQLSIGRVVFEQITATEAQSKVMLRGQRLTLGPLAFNFYGGHYQGNLEVSWAGGGPRFTASGRFSGVDVNQFLSAASSLKNVVYGRASGNLNLSGAGKELDVRAINGPGQLIITDGQFTSFDLVRQIEIIARLSGLPAGNGVTKFSLLRTDFRFDNGKLLTNNLRLEMEQMGVTGNGALQLGESVTVGHDLLAQLSQELTRRIIPGGNIWAAAGTFFLEQGRLSVPFRMSGPITQPGFSLDSRLVQERLKERILRKPEDTVKGILDIFKKKPKPEEEQRKP